MFRKSIVLHCLKDARCCHLRLVILVDHPFLFLYLFLSLYGWHGIIARRCSRHKPLILLPMDTNPLLLDFDVWIITSAIPARITQQIYFHISVVFASVAVEFSLNHLNSVTSAAMPLNGGVAANTGGIFGDNNNRYTMRPKFKSPSARLYLSSEESLSALQIPNKGEFFLQDG